MASPLNNPWVSGGLGVGILVYFTVTFTPEAWQRPVRDFFTGELKREGGQEPELKAGSEKLFRAVPRVSPERMDKLLRADPVTLPRNLFREIPKGVKERPKEAVPVPDMPEGAGLLAVWMDGETRVAVMTDVAVREGEPWGAFTVEKIGPEAVTLRHATGVRVVRLGEVQRKAADLKVAPPGEAKPAEGSPETQLQKLMEMQKAMDPSKMMPGLPQKLLDAFRGKPQAPATSP